MGQSDKAKLEIESGQTIVENEALTDSGDHQLFTFSEPIVSVKTKARINPNGVSVGTNLISVGNGNDNVATVTFKGKIGGVEYTFAADSSVAITRTAVGVPFSKHAIVGYLNAGTPEIKVVSGSGHATAHSATYGAAGGPPLIGVDEVRLGEVWTSSDVAAPITASEIHQNGSYTERSTYPGWKVRPLGFGNAAKAVGEDEAHLKFNSALPLSHTGGVPKGVYATYEGVEFSELEDAADFKPPSETSSVSSVQTYSGLVSSTSKSVSAGSFTQMLEDGITDPIFAADGESVVFKFTQDKNNTPYILCVGTVSIDTDYSATSVPKATISFPSEHKTARFNG